MLRVLFFILACALLSTLAPAQRVNFDQGWKFALGNATDATKDFGFSRGSFSAFAKAGTDAGPIGLGFNDAAWRDVQLPHDWAVELPFDRTADGSHGFKPVGRDFPGTSIGWYRKSFTIPKTSQGKRFRITFDGIFRDSMVFLNGHFMGSNNSGYVGVTYDLTDYLKYGERNVISVRVDASFMEGWFYEGAGIYRHAWLQESEAASFATDGVSVIATVEPTPKISVRAELENLGDNPVNHDLEVVVKDKSGMVVAHTTAQTADAPAHGTVVAEAEVSLPSVKRWSPEDPYLYTVEVGYGSEKLNIHTGFRTIKFDVERGFLLNGKVYRIQGVCDHQDHAGVGAAVPDRLNEWRIKQLQSFGCNFLRTSHNPPTPELLDACDRLGFMVLDETRMFGSTGEALSQLTRFVRRDRNHPSVIFWSIGNEEWGTQDTDEGARIATSMMRSIKELDPTRTMTIAANNGGQLKGINSVIPVRGFNYSLSQIDDYRKARPDQPVLGSEVASTVTTRGEYQDDKVKAYVNAYDTQKISWGSTAEAWWKITLDHEWFAGGFVWTGFDYRGEPTPYEWPNVNSHFGVLDTCGFYKDVAFYYKAWWTPVPVLHIFPHWSWPGMEGKPIDVWVFSNHEAVELFLNGKSLGRKEMSRGGHLAWTVPYQPGTLSAKAYDAGKVTQEASLNSETKAKSLSLKIDSPDLNADGADVAIINVSALDANGLVAPWADQSVEFEVTGPAEIIGVGNGDPSSHEPDVLIPTRPILDLSGWRWTSIAKAADNLPETAESFDISTWKPTDLKENQLADPNTSAVFATDFNVADPAAFRHLGIGHVDDLGQVFLNGVLVGKTTDWNGSYVFDIAGKLKTGQNRLTVVVENKGASGGMMGGQTLIGEQSKPAYRRSLFHGLAQLIIRSTGQAGKVTVHARAPGLGNATVTATAIRIGG